MRKKADVIAAIKEAKAAANEADDDQTGDNEEPCLLYTSRCV